MSTKSISSITCLSTMRYDWRLLSPTITTYGCNLLLCSTTAPTSVEPYSNFWDLNRGQQQSYKCNKASWNCNYCTCRVFLFYQLDILNDVHLVSSVLHLNYLPNIWQCTFSIQVHTYPGCNTKTCRNTLSQTFPVYLSHINNPACIHFTTRVRQQNW